MSQVDGFVHAGEALPFVTQWRPARVLKVVDGDTFDLDIDLGFESHIYTRVRLLHLAGLENRKLAVDAWETRGEEKPLGDLATLRVEELVQQNNWEVLVATRLDPKISKGTYGRWLAAVLLRDRMDRDDDLLASLGDLLIREGHAEEKKYR